MRLGTLAPAKVNVCLCVGPTRPDGRHELVSVIQSVSLADRVTLETLPEGKSDEVKCPGIPQKDNLATAALVALRETADWRGPTVRISIDKRIPVAAGMAGGSADAAAVLRLAGRLAGVRDRAKLLEIATGVGADVPGQVTPGRWLATGAGELLDRVPGVPPYAVLVVPDRTGLLTADVFAEADKLGLPRDAAGLGQKLREIRAALPDLPDALCVNELEPATLSLRPKLAERLDAIRGAGADVAMVSGSGPTVLGLFRDQAAARAALKHFDGAVLARPVGREAGEVLPA